MRRLAHHLQKWEWIRSLTLSTGVPSSGSLDDRIRRALPRDVWDLIYQIDELTTLDLSGCHHLTADQLSFLLHLCPRLKSLILLDLDCVDHRVTRQMGDACPRLTALSVSCSMTEFLAGLVPSFPPLTSLHLEGMGELVGEEEIEMLGMTFRQLRHLQLSDCDIGDNGLIVLANHCPHLTSVEIFDHADSITAAGVLAIAERCSHLIHLSVHSNRFILTPQILRSLADRRPELRSFSVYFDELETELFSELTGAFPELQRLHLDDEAGDVHLNFSRLHSAKLTDLDLSGDPRNIWDEDLCLLLHQCPALTRLTLCGSLMDCFPLLASPLPSFGLTHLDLTGCRLLTDTTLVILAPRLPGLKHLNLTNCTGLTDTAVERLLRWCTALEHLLFGCRFHSWSPLRITDRSLHHLAAHDRPLTHLTLGKILEPSDTSFCAVLDRCPKLIELHLKDASFLTDSTFDRMGQHPCLQRFSTESVIHPRLEDRLRHRYPLLDVISDL